MAESKRINRIQRLFRDDRAADASPVATERVELSKSINDSKKPIRNLFHRLSQRSTAIHSLPSRAPYQYTPLNDDLKEIRLLTLHEGSFKADIRISIHTAPLTPDNIPTYEALSYVWGSLENQISIQVGVHTLAVTQNLAEALPYLRYRDKPRVLWIDAICVDQQDLKERSRQVRRMADIYRLADRVIVWLGPCNKDSSYGVRLLEELSSKMTVNWVHQTMEPMSNGTDRYWADRDEGLPYGDGELRALYSLMSYPWFERLWVWQEIWLAKSNAMMVCGSDTIPWESFRTALFCLYWKAYHIKQTSVISEQFRVRVIETYPLANNEMNLPFLDILHYTRYCKYTDPKDRVYAILSLQESPGEAIDIEPDYEKSTSQVYQDVTLCCIDRHKSLEILKFSGMTDRPSEMPTWALNPTTVETPLPLLSGLASGCSESEVQSGGAGILSVTGNVSATVQHVDRIECRDYGSLIAEIRRLAPRDVLQGSYIGSGSLLTAYCNTLCVKRFDHVYLPHREVLPHFQQSLDFLSAILQPGIKQVPDYSHGTQAEKFLDYTWSYCKERSFVKTPEGYIGLAPLNAQPGDQVCILLGSKFPMLLRPTSKSQYQVIGSCYVHGLTNGEAFLGPMPEQYQPILAFDEVTRRYFWGFLDHGTGKTQWNDPRVDSLPEDGTDKEDPMVLFPDGSQQRLLTPEMIKRRGVKLQTFDLI